MQDYERPVVASYGSRAETADVEAYRYGLCHAFAVALHRRFGWSLLAALDHEQVHWQNPRDPDDCIPVVVHVVAVDGDGAAWDIGGKRDVEELERDIEGWGCCFGRYGTDDCLSEVELRDSYVERRANGSGRYPLDVLTEADVEAADKILDAALGDIPGYPDARVNTPGR